MKRFLSALLCGALLTGSAGVDAYAAVRGLAPAGRAAAVAPLLRGAPALAPSLGTSPGAASVSVPPFVAAPAPSLPASAASRPRAELPGAAAAAPVPVLALPVAAVPGPAARPAGVLERLSEGVAPIVEAAAADRDPEAGRAAAGSFFEGSHARPGSEPATGAAAEGPRDSALSLRSGPRGPSGATPAPVGQPQEPRQKLSRSLRVGLIAAVAPLALTFAAITIATALGYEMHPNYKSPMTELDGPPSLLIAAILSMAAAVMAPISEEIIFRAGLQGGLAKLTRKIPLVGAFWIPALLSSLIFVAVHETSDPLLFGTRLVHSMILSYAFKKEGLFASIAAHGFFNGLLVVPLLLSALLGPMLGGLASLLAAPAAMIAAFFAYKALRAERPEIESGRQVPFQLTRTRAWLLALVLTLGFVVMPNPIWAAGVIGLVLFALFSSRS